MEMSSVQAESHSEAVGDELECEICCQRYDTQSCRPKVLFCRHRLCARCLGSILGMGGAPQHLRCPFCRHDTDITLCQVADLPDDSNIIAQLATTEKCCPSECRGVVSLPQGLSSSLAQYSSSCLITIMDMQLSPSWNGSSDRNAEQSLDSISISSNSQVDQDGPSKLCRHMPRILVWLLGFLYFGSLPLGIYMLVIQKVTLGIVCISVVPCSLAMCMVYAFYQCLCQERAPALQDNDGRSWFNFYLEF
ncbi:E3 ubiquitin-protein ligase RNF182-like [Brienomyrus brachyistius]|uniref:E3 ubiquitin-protein ligase RNF182-like n=1 Tax=Brienomyrus brachyistius TaxID=42636 RepID=UPI0020B1C3BE|nr:E3 ubiquitin-protein ligase RNF182-like [Brienomyrus brachyistius]